jgi:hypothetical protein
LKFLNIDKTEKEETNDEVWTSNDKVIEL